MELRYWLVPGNVKNNRKNYLNEKRSLIFIQLIHSVVFHVARHQPAKSVCVHRLTKIKIVSFVFVFGMLKLMETDRSLIAGISFSYFSGEI